MLYVIGYFGHNNFGDEQYKVSFKKLFKIEEIEFIDCDKLDRYKFDETDIIVLGGGDVINNYFLDKLSDKFNYKKNNIYAISVGIPFLDIIIKTPKKLMIFNKIFVRTQQDITLLKQYYKDIYYLPDISCNIFDTPNSIMSIRRNSTKTICFCLSRNIYDKNNIELYNMFINNLSHIISYLVCKKYNIIFVPFNTNNINSNENDIYIQNDIMDLLTNNIKKNITNITITQSLADVQQIFSKCDLIIPMRFHATLFSIYLNIPCIPLITTRKLINLMKDIDWKYKYILPLDNKFKPTDLNMNRFTNILTNLLDNYKDAVKHLTIVNKKINKYYLRINPIIQNILENKETKKNIYNNTTENLTDVKIKLIMKKVKEIFPLYPDITNEEEQKICVQYISYHLTNNIDSQYNHGLLEKIFNKEYDYLNEWKWIISDVLNNNDKVQKTTTRIINNYKSTKYYKLNYINLYNNENIHRSGWDYVISNLIKYHSDDEKLPILDLYLDKTFHWNEQINKILDIIPYNTNWYGFIHHTCDTTFSKYNTIELFQKESFIRSLVYCKGLIVLSNDLKTKVIYILSKLNLSNIPVYSICHPTEVNVELFNLDKFEKNKERSIIHIGAWLRNIYSYYNTDFPNNIEKKSYFSNNIYLSLNRKILKGLQMMNYFPSDEIVNKLKPSHSFDNNYGCISDESFCANNLDKNNWHNHFYENINNKLNSIEILQFKTNDEYDKLLTQNIVFLNLVDVSACNTLIECIVRNTPIIINKHPAVVELLGKDYPLYFNSNSLQYDIYKILTYDNIKKAHNYLKKLDKAKYTIEDFILKLNNIFIKM